MTRDAAGLLYEADTDVLQQREAALDRLANGSRRRRRHADRRRPGRPSGVVSRRRFNRPRLGRTPGQRPSFPDELRTLETIRAKECRGHAAGILGADAEFQKDTKHLGIIDARRFTQGRRVGRVPGRRVGPVIEQQAQRRRGADNSARDHERRSPVVRSRVDISACIEQELHPVAIGRRPHEGGCACAVPRVGIGARSQKAFHQSGVAIQGRRHQRC